MNDGSTAERESMDVVSAFLIFIIAYPIAFLTSSRFRELCPLLAAAAIATLATLPFLLS